MCSMPNCDTVPVVHTIQGVGTIIVSLALCPRCDAVKCTVCKEYAPFNTTKCPNGHRV